MDAPLAFHFAKTIFYPTWSGVRAGSKKVRRRAKKTISQFLKVA
jgi:hypothetical protein